MRKEEHFISLGVKYAIGSMGSQAPHCGTGAGVMWQHRGAIVAAVWHITANAPNVGPGASDWIM